MFHAVNRPVHVLKLEIQSFDPETDTFALALTLDTYPRDNDCPEAAAVAESQAAGKKASLSLKEVGGRWMYELSDSNNVVNIIGSPTKASAKISGAEVEELKWTIEAEGIPAERLLTLCRWHGAAVDLCAEPARDEDNNSEPPLLALVKSGEVTITAQLAPLNHAAEPEPAQAPEWSLTVVLPATVIKAAAKAREEQAAQLRATNPGDTLAEGMANLLDADARRVRAEGQAAFGTLGEDQP